MTLCDMRWPPRNYAAQTYCYFRQDLQEFRQHRRHGGDGEVEAAGKVTETGKWGHQVGLPTVTWLPVAETMATPIARKKRENHFVNYSFLRKRATEKVAV
jgi:hypothetical protein